VAACQNYNIQHSQIMAIALAATHLAENIKNLALSNSSNYTGGKLAITLTKIQHS